MCAAFFVFWAGKCGIHGNCQFVDGISGNVCNISITDIYSDYSQLSVFVYGYGGMFASGNATLANVYPVTASLGLISYRSYDPAVHWNVLICLISMIVVLMITAVFVFTAKGNVPVKAAKKHKKTITKKGW